MKKNSKDNELVYHLTPKGVLICAIDMVLGDDTLTKDQKNLIWLAFDYGMRRAGYVKEEAK